jgi:hypothetical protein
LDRETRQAVIGIQPVDDPRIRDGPCAPVLDSSAASVHRPMEVVLSAVKALFVGASGQALDVLSRCPLVVFQHQAAVTSSPSIMVRAVCPRQSKMSVTTIPHFSSMNSGRAEIAVILFGLPSILLCTHVRRFSDARCAQDGDAKAIAEYVHLRAICSGVPQEGEMRGKRSNGAQRQQLLRLWSNPQ